MCKDMFYQFIHTFLLGVGVIRFARLGSIIILLLVAIVLAVFLQLLTRTILASMAKKTKARMHAQWPSALLKNKIPQRLSNLVIPLVILLVAGDSPQAIIPQAVGVITILALLFLLFAVLGVVDDVYASHEISKIRPIKGLLQIIKVTISIIAGVASLSVLLGQNPFLMVGGIGAFAAVASFVFKDPILNFVAGIQLTANNMLRIGDWIEVPRYDLSGDVTEISMTTVKVQNFDHTITSIPAQHLVNDALINWRGMQDAGGRRIKRSIHIHAGHVRLCDEEMIDRFRRIALITPYMELKLAELAVYNQSRSVLQDEPLNVRAPAHQSGYLPRLYGGVS
ncbi:MAG: MscS Mechanosensitive ion channel [Firmicutes bacterium]|nr:MscS Mechanosensitive ion channel [Bacillota bacterium]